MRKRDKLKVILKVLARVSEFGVYLSEEGGCG